MKEVQWWWFYSYFKMKKIFHQLHLWLGLVSGLLVFVIAITGALYAFQEEIGNLSPYKHVAVQDKEYLMPSVLEDVARRALPDKDFHGIKYNHTGKSAEAVFYGFNPPHYNIVYLNPYTGEVLKVKDMSKDFFRVVMTGHFYLWLPPRIGQPLVAWSTLVFVLVLITGIIIWLPKKLKTLKHRVWFSWNRKTKFPRINYDLHVIGGVYAALFGLIFALTGLVWGFQWFAQGYYKLIGGKKSLEYAAVLSAGRPGVTDTIAQKPADAVWLLLKDNYMDAAFIEIDPPQTDSSAVAVHVAAPDGKYWKTDYRYFDQYALKEIEVGGIYGKLKNADKADKLFRMNYDIHTGAILGLPGKIIAFLMSLFIATLPVTGVIIWWKKRRKKFLH